MARKRKPRIKEKDLHGFKHFKLLTPCWKSCTIAAVSATRQGTESFTSVNTPHSFSYVKAYARGDAGTKRGVWASTEGAGTNYGVYAGASGGTNNYGVYAAGDTWAGYFSGRGYFKEEVGVGDTTPSHEWDVNGDIGCVTLHESSDRRFKTNIDGVADALAKVGKLRGVQFDCRREEYPDRKLPEGRQVGFIALEVGEVLPEVVSKDGDGFYSADYGRVVPVLVEAVSELHGMVGKKDAQIAVQQVQITELAARLAALEKLMRQVNTGREGGGRWYAGYSRQLRRPHADIRGCTLFRAPSASAGSSIVDWGLPIADCQGVQWAPAYPSPMRKRGASGPSLALAMLHPSFALGARIVAP